MIRKLEWDTAFFGLKIGEWEVEKENFNNFEKFDLIYVKTGGSAKPDLPGFSNKFSETKVIYQKTLHKHQDSWNKLESVVDGKYLDELYEIAFESGKFSRFKLDSHFGTANFKKLYMEWVNNSISRNIADDVLIYKEGDTVAGMVTYRQNNTTHATIGLIAVTAACQGRGIGKKMLQFVENSLIENNIFDLRIPTQEVNNNACSFYENQGYNKIETINIMHYYKNDTF